MEPNRVEQEFRDKLEQRTIQPSKMAWDRLDAMLSVNEEKEEQKVVAISKPNRSWMYMAASFVLFATIGAFFLTRETGNGSNGIEDSGTTIVKTDAEKTTAPVLTNDTIPSQVQPATTNIGAPKMRDNAVASTQTTKASNPSKTNAAAPYQSRVENNNGIIQENNKGVATVTHEGQKQDEEVVNNFETEKLLAANNPAPKKKSTIKVNAGSLLSSVEGELDESFRDKALKGVIKNFNEVKSSVANRNYQ